MKPGGHSSRCAGPYQSNGDLGKTDFLYKLDRWVGGQPTIGRARSDSRRSRRHVQLPRRRLHTRALSAQVRYTLIIARATRNRSMYLQPTVGLAFPLHIYQVHRGMEHAADRRFVRRISSYDTILSAGSLLAVSEPLELHTIHHPTSATLRHNLYIAIRQLPRDSTAFTTFPSPQLTLARHYLQLE